MKIFKYPIRIEDRQEIQMPRGARILCVQMQGERDVTDHGVPLLTASGQPFIWAAVDPSRGLVPRKFRVVGTGHEVDDVFSATMNYQDNVSYVGTFQQAGGALVWHLFDLGEAP